MVRWFGVLGLAAVAIGAVALAVEVASGWWWVAAPLLFLSAVGVHDLLQTHHSILRNCPRIGHARFMIEEIRPEIQQYFVESNTDGRLLDRVMRDLMYVRAKCNHGEKPFGTKRDV